MVRKQLLSGFSGLEKFQAAASCEATELVHFRKRIGEGGTELILKESIWMPGCTERLSENAGR